MFLLYSTFLLQKGGVTTSSKKSPMQESTEYRYSEQINYLHELPTRRDTDTAYTNIKNLKIWNWDHNLNG